MIELQIGDYKAVLTMDHGTITFDRYYKGEEDSKITHVFDDRLHDDFSTYSTDPYWVAVMIHWCCTGVAANSVELAAIRATIAQL